MLKLYFLIEMLEAGRNTVTLVFSLTFEKLDFLNFLNIFFFIAMHPEAAVNSTQ